MRWSLIQATRRVTHSSQLDQSELFREEVHFKNGTQHPHFLYRLSQHILPTDEIYPLKLATENVRQENDCYCSVSFMASNKKGLIF